MTAQWLDATLINWVLNRRDTSVLHQGVRKGNEPEDSILYKQDKIYQRAGDRRVLKSFRAATTRS